MYCYKCDSYVCSHQDYSVSRGNKYQDDLGYLEDDFIGNPKLFEPAPLLPLIEPDYKKVGIYDDPLLQKDPWGPPLQPIFRPLNMDMAHWCLAPTPPGFIKFG